MAVVYAFATRSFWCPARGRNVAVEFLEEPATGLRVRVRACDAFDPPRAVACQCTCLVLPKLPPRRSH